MLLQTAESTYVLRAARDQGVLRPGRHAESVLDARRRDREAAAATGMVLPPLFEPAAADTAGHPVRVRVNHGRWIVECPQLGCCSAQFASRDDQRFFCVDCGNQFIEGRWLTVDWPDDADTIERALAPRPVAFQNWDGEPVEQLLADNADPVNGLI